MSNSKEKTCFVIRPFDSLYNERHDKIFAPAIESAGLSVHLAGGPGVSEITKEIEDGIRNAHICFADVSEDNPNVWYEVGFAYACGKNVAMVCNTDMRKLKALPFDVRQRNVISYNKLVDFDDRAVTKLQEKITEHIEKLPKTDPPSASQLSPKEVNILFDIMMYCLEKKSPMPHSNLEDWYDTLTIEISIQNLKEKRYILDKYSIDAGSFLEYKITDKAKKFFRDNNKLPNK